MTSFAELTKTKNCVVNNCCLNCKFFEEKNEKNDEWQTQTHKCVYTQKNLTKLPIWLGDSEIYTIPIDSTNPYYNCSVWEWNEFTAGDGSG